MNDLPATTPAPPEIPAPATLVCSNCNAVLTGEYCADCGQRHEPHVHSVTHFASEAFESITHADSRLWRTLWFLLAKPGRLTREFFDGRRASYLPPFRLYLVISLLFFLIAGLPESGFVELDGVPPTDRAASMNEIAEALEGDLAKVEGAAEAAAAIRAQAALEAAKAPDTPATAADATDAADAADARPVRGGLQENNAFTEFCKSFGKEDPKAGKNYARLRAACLKTGEDRGDALLQAIVHNIPRAMFVFLPLLALIMKLLYLRPQRYYVEHLLLLVHNHAFVFLALTLVALLEMIPVVGEHLGLLKVAVWLYIAWYIYKSMRVYYAQSRTLTVTKYLAMELAYISTVALVFVLTAIFSALTM